MTSYQAIGALDPYFLQAYSSPNNYQYQQQLIQQPLLAQNVEQVDSVQQSENVPNINFKGAESVVQQPKKNHTAAWLVLGSIATVGAACLIHKGQKAGANGIFDQFITGFKSLIGKTDDKVLTFGLNNGKRVCTIPGKENILNNSQTIADDLNKLGFNGADKLDFAKFTTTLNDGTKVLSPELKINSGTFNIGECIVTFKDGKVIKCINKNGDDILNKYIEAGNSTTNSSDFQEQKTLIDNFIKNLRKEENFKNIQDFEVEHSTNQITRKFVRTNPTDDFKIQSAQTKYFSLDDNIVKTYSNENPKTKEILDKFGNGENIGNVVYAEYYSDEIGTLVIEGNNISSIRTIDGKSINKGSSEYNDLHKKYKDLFEKALRNELESTNITYTAI